MNSSETVRKWDRISASNCKLSQNFWDNVESQQHLCPFPSILEKLRVSHGVYEIPRSSNNWKRCSTVLCYLNFEFNGDTYFKRIIDISMRSCVANPLLNLTKISLKRKIINWCHMWEFVSWSLSITLFNYKGYRYVISVIKMIGIQGESQICTASIISQIYNFWFRTNIFLP